MASPSNIVTSSRHAPAFSTAFDSPWIRTWISRCSASSCCISSDTVSNGSRRRSRNSWGDYEYGAARFGMQLLHEAGIRDFDQWYADFVVTDWQYLERYYREGAIPPWRECVATDQPLIRPESIPPLEHKQMEVRFAF